MKYNHFMKYIKSYVNLIWCYLLQKKIYAIVRQKPSFPTNEGEGKEMTIYDFKNSCSKNVFIFLLQFLKISEYNTYYFFLKNLLLSKLR